MTPMKERAAQCICGGLRVTVRGEPADAYLCSCAYCQRKSGSAFTYAAIYPEAAVTITGEYRTWRHRGDAGRFLDNAFCPACGGSVFFRAEAWPGMLGIAVGCFADRDFATPARLFWASQRHRWLELPDAIALIETQ